MIRCIRYIYVNTKVRACPLSCIFKSTGTLIITFNNIVFAVARTSALATAF